MKEISKGKDQKIVERIVKAVVDMFKDTKKEQENNGRRQDKN